MALFKQTPSVQRPKGSKTPIYTFSVLNPETYPIHVRGKSTSDTEGSLSILPEDCFSPTIARTVFESWLKECSSQFLKPPTIEQCLSHYKPIQMENLPMVSISPDEEDIDWLLLWVPTRIEIENPTFRIVWAPLQKCPSPIDIGEDTDLTLIDDSPEVQGPERTYTVITGARPEQWTEVNELPLSMSSNPPLRLDGDLSIDIQREKYRKRVRDARLRAKLARYRAERLEHRFFERFGVWPEEDADEAQTEAENSDEEELT